MTRPRVAAIVTTYFPRSHADVIVTKLLEGYDLHGVRTEPRLKVASLYMDQVATNDVGLELAAKHAVPTFDTVGEAIAVGVDGVLVIGEHGNYPTNEVGQKLYPRRRLFDATVAALVGLGRAVPIFVDKHLSWSFGDARRMYDTAERLGMPLLAGSSLPLAWRVPPLSWPLECKVEGALALGYSDLEAYGFHALETLQCMTERRYGGETGVRSVRCVEGDAVWDAADDGRWDVGLLDAAMSAVTTQGPRDPKYAIKPPAVFLIEYLDGLPAVVAMLDSHTSQFAFAGRRDGAVESTCFWLQDGPPHGHFTFLVRQFEEMVLTGHPPYSAARTLLTTGILDAAMRSRHAGHIRVETPELAIRYQATDIITDTGCGAALP